MMKLFTLFVKDLKPLEPQPGQQTVKSFFEVSSDSDKKTSPLKRIGNTKIYLRKTALHPSWKRDGEENDDFDAEKDGDVEVEKNAVGVDSTLTVKREIEVSVWCTASSGENVTVGEVLPVIRS